MLQYFKILVAGFCSFFPKSEGGPKENINTVDMGLAVNHEIDAPLPTWIIFVQSLTTVAWNTTLHSRGSPAGHYVFLDGSQFGSSELIHSTHVALITDWWMFCLGSAVLDLSAARLYQFGSQVTDEVLWADNWLRRLKHLWLESSPQRIRKAAVKGEASKNVKTFLEQYFYFSQNKSQTCRE